MYKMEHDSKFAGSQVHSQTQTRLYTKEEVWAYFLQIWSTKCIHIYLVELFRLMKSYLFENINLCHLLYNNMHFTFLLFSYIPLMFC